MTVDAQNDAAAGGGDSTAVEESARPTVARRQRLFALPGGVVLAVCIFLPTLRVCGSPTYPITMPPFWSPYLLGVIVAGLAATRRVGGLRAPIIAAQVLVAMTALGWGLVTAGAGKAAGAPWALGFGLVAWAFVGATRRGDLEARAANVVIASGVICTPWFAMLAFDPDGMIGAWISLGASLALILAGLEWRRELAHGRLDRFPRAVARTA